MSVFSRLLALDPANPETRHYLATAQLMAERPNDAIETLKPLLQASDPNSKTLQLAASAYEAAGDTPQAVSLLRQAIISDPRNVALYLDFASISMDHQSFPAGIAMINSGLNLQPNAAELYLARGVLYVQMAQYDQAEADFDKANALNPERAIGSAALGLEAVQKNSPDEALATVRSRLAKKPNDAYLLFLQAEILNQKGVEAGMSVSNRSGLGEESSFLTAGSCGRAQPAGETLPGGGAKPRGRRGEQEGFEYRSKGPGGGVSPDSGAPKNRRQGRAPEAAQTPCRASPGGNQNGRAAQPIQADRGECVAKSIPPPLSGGPGIVLSAEKLRNSAGFCFDGFLDRPSLVASQRRN